MRCRGRIPGCPRQPTRRPHRSSKNQASAEERGGEWEERDGEESRGDEQLGGGHWREGEQAEASRGLAPAPEESLLRRRKLSPALGREVRARMAGRRCKDETARSRGQGSEEDSGIGDRSELRWKNTSSAHVGGPKAGSRLTPKMQPNASSQSLMAEDETGGSRSRRGVRRARMTCSTPSSCTLGCGRPVDIRLGSGIRLRTSPQRLRLSSSCGGAHRRLQRAR